MRLASSAKTRIASLAACATAALACGIPAPRVRCVAPETIEVDIATLGEYPTDLARATLVDTAADCVVWDIRGKNELQVHRLVFAASQPVSAPVNPFHGDAEVVSPAASSILTLTPTTPYQLTLQAGRWAPKRNVHFNLAHCRP